MTDPRRGTRGQAAERLVAQRIRAVVDPRVLVLDSVHWLVRDRGVVTNGEADLVVADPERGILVLEIKSGEIRRDADRTWWAGPHRLPRGPFEQAMVNRYALLKKLHELPGWPAGLSPNSGHAVAFPDVDLDTMRGRLGLLGLDADSELVADQSMFVDSEAGRAELRRFIDGAFDSWGQNPNERAPGEKAIEVLRAMGAAPFEMASMLRHEMVEGEREVVRLTTGQLRVLNELRNVRRASIIGGAGTGKTLLAAEKARRLAGEGYETLLVCFNAPLARMLGEELQTTIRDTGRLDVKTFHQLCEDLGREADVLDSRPTSIPQEWWDRTLPRALDEAIERLGARYHAIVIDEAQDFHVDWLASLQELLVDGADDVLYVFHDPAQAIYREDVVGQLGLTEYPIETNCRNTEPIHALVARFAEGGLASEAWRTGGRAPELIEADGDPATVEALRGVLHRLRAVDGEAVDRRDIAVLTGARLEESAVWGVPGHRYGNEVLGNPTVDDAGHHLGLPAHLAPELDRDLILCETIRRFKGLERPVIVLVELRADDPKLERKLYVGASRARQHLVVIAPAAVLGRLR
jgi:AAA domain-containing protein/UvrD-like helicase family protein/nuclease-like protein